MFDVPKRDGCVPNDGADVDAVKYIKLLCSLKLYTKLDSLLNTRYLV